MRKQGLLITFEGPDGAGKTTQINKFAAYLKQRKQCEFIVTREPGGTAISDQIRSLLLNPAHKEMVDEAEVLLYAASRAQHVQEKIVPALDKGMIVLCDRFVDASVAYQGYGLEIDVNTILNINEFATGGLSPHRTYLLDISPQTARQRLITRYKQQGLDRIEQKQYEFHERVRNGFFRLYEENRERICFIDGDQTADEIFREIVKDFETFCQKLK